MIHLDGQLTTDGLRGSAGPFDARIHASVRQVAPALVEDRPPAPDLEAVARLIASGAIEEAAGLAVK